MKIVKSKKVNVKSSILFVFLLIIFHLSPFMVSDASEFYSYGFNSDEGFIWLDQGTPESFGDSSGHIRSNANRIDLVNYTNQERTHARMVKTVLANQDFVLDFDFNLVSAVSALPAYFSVGISDTDFTSSGDAQTTGNGCYALLGIGTDISTRVAYVRSVKNGVATTTLLSSALVAGTTYYGRLKRFGTSLTFTIYTDSTRLAVHSTATIADCCVVECTQFYTALTYTLSASRDGTAWIDNFALNLNPVGYAPYAPATPYQFQNGAWFDGTYYYVTWYDGDGVTGAVPKIAYASDDDLKFGTAHVIPYLGNVTRGYEINSFYGFRTSYGIISAFQTGTSPKIVHAYKENDSLNASNKMGAPYEGAITEIEQYSVVLLDENEYVWVGGIKTSVSPYELNVRRSSAPYDISAFDIKHTLKTTTVGGTVQLVGYSNGDIGALYCIGSAGASTLYYQHYTAVTSSWGSEETVDTNVGAYLYNWKGVVTRNDKLFVIFRDYTTYNFQYRIRTRSTGTWNSKTIFCTDQYGTAASSAMTATANVGEEESVYVFYLTAAPNIVYRSWNGSVVSDPTTFIPAGQFTLKSGTFTSPLFDSSRIPFIWHAINNYIQIKVLQLTPTQVSSQGVLVAKDSNSNQAMGMIYHNGKSLCFYKHRGNRIKARIYNHNTNSWEGSWSIISKRYCDIGHNQFAYAKDDSGYVYIAYGGRQAANTTEYVVVKKSTLPIDNASFDPSSWTDISPVNLTGRGYKALIVDNYNIPHLLFWDGDYIMNIREYRSGTWSSPTNIVTTADSTIYLYFEGWVLGKEVSGQKSIHMIWSYRDTDVQPEVTGGSILQQELNYMKIVPQGDGTYKAYKADGTELTLPCSESNRDNIYNGATGADWIRYVAGIDVNSSNSPYIVYARCLKISPYTINGLYCSRWNGVVWTESQIESTGFPWMISPRLVIADKFYTLSQKEYGDITESILYNSADGITWTPAVRKTISTYDTYGAGFEYRTLSEKGFFWGENLHRNYGEVIFDTNNYSSSGFGLIK